MRLGMRRAEALDGEFERVGRRGQQRQAAGERQAHPLRVGERLAEDDALADPQRMRLALNGRLALLPAPAEEIELSVERFGPPNPEARALFDDGAARRDERLREAISQARAIAGPDAALRVLEIDPNSRVPERRVVLAPFDAAAGRRPPHGRGAPA